MIPNITTGKGFGGLLSYLMMDKETGLPRPEASLIGGTLFGRTVSQLTTEFGLIRRLRPQAEEGVVLHHSLSFAATENPTDEQINQYTDRYLEHMGLEEFPHTRIVHRDKGCIHIHLGISRVGADGSWANTWYDQLKSQKAAAFVEIEFGLVQVERPKMRARIDREWAQLRKERPDIKEALEPQPLARPELMGELGIKAQIRLRLESIPAGLTLPEWIEACEIEGLHLVPNMGTDKLTGWTVQLKGTESKPLALGKVGKDLSWPKLLEAGRVIFNHDEHFAFALKCKENKHDKPAVALGPQLPGPPGIGLYPRDGGTLDWDWQPVQGDPGLPEPEGPSLVELVVAPRLRPGTFGRDVRTPSVAKVHHPKPEAAARAPRPPVGSNWRSVAHLAPSVHASVARIRELHPDGGYAFSSGSREHLADRGPIGRSNYWAQPYSDQPASRPGSVARMHDRRPAPASTDRYGDLHHQPLGGLQAPSGGRAGSGSRSVSVGVCLDRRGVEALKINDIVRKAMEPFRTMLREFITDPIASALAIFTKKPQLAPPAWTPEPVVDLPSVEDLVITAASHEAPPITLDGDFDWMDDYRPASKFAHKSPEPAKPVEKAPAAFQEPSKPRVAPPAPESTWRPRR